MAIYFLDSSAVVKHYVAETGSSWFRGLLTPENDVYLSRLAGVEVVAALARRTPSQSLGSRQAQRAIRQFRRDLRDHYLIIEVTAELANQAMALAEKRYLRGYDALQLATAQSIAKQAVALGLPALTLVSADDELNVAAAAEGLSVENPNLHP